MGLSIKTSHTKKMKKENIKQLNALVFENFQKKSKEIMEEVTSVVDTHDDSGRYPAASMSLIADSLNGWNLTMDKHKRAYHVINHLKNTDVEDVEKYMGMLEGEKVILKKLGYVDDETHHEIGVMFRVHINKNEGSCILLELANDTKRQESGLLAFKMGHNGDVDLLKPLPFTLFEEHILYINGYLVNGIARDIRKELYTEWKN